MIMQVVHVTSIQCPPLTESQAPANARIAAGKYLLIVESKHGRAMGMLQLWPSTVQDRSPSHPEIRPDPVKIESVPLYGWTSVDFDSVGVQFPPDTGARAAPAPTSTDPLFPGVLVSAGQPPMLFIGSQGNRRDRVTVEDGGGIALIVRHVSATAGFAGTWEGAGLVREPSGRFCAFPALNRSP